MLVSILVFLGFLLAIIYLIFLLKVRHGIYNVRIIEHIPQRPVKVSIVIPFRNEEAHIVQSLQSILKLDYDTDYLEAIYVNSPVRGIVSDYHDLFFSTTPPPDWE